MSDSHMSDDPYNVKPKSLKAIKQSTKLESNVKASPTKATPAATSQHRTVTHPQESRVNQAKESPSEVVPLAPKLNLQGNEKIYVGPSLADPSLLPNLLPKGQIEMQKSAPDGSIAIDDNSTMLSQVQHDKPDPGKVHSVKKGPNEAQPNKGASVKTVDSKKPKSVICHTKSRSSGALPTTAKKPTNVKAHRASSKASSSSATVNSKQRKSAEAQGKKPKSPGKPATATGPRKPSKTTIKPTEDKPKQQQKLRQESDTNKQQQPSRNKSTLKTKSATRTDPPKTNAPEAKRCTSKTAQTKSKPKPKSSGEAGKPKPKKQKPKSNETGASQNDKNSKKN